MLDYFNDIMLIGQLGKNGKYVEYSIRYVNDTRRDIYIL